jgi:hypothetical protein
MCIGGKQSLGYHCRVWTGQTLPKSVEPDKLG